MVKLPLLLLGVLCLTLGASVSGGTSLAFGLAANNDRPGLGLAALCFFDILVVYSYCALLVEVVGLGAFSGRVQWIVALVVAILGLIYGILFITIALALLNVMLALFLSIPFGTAIYMVVFGLFSTHESRLILSMVMTLKIAGLVLVALGAPGILANKPLMILSAISLLLTFALGFLHALVPDFLVSIVDAVAAIVFGIVAMVFLVLLLFSGLGSLLRAIRGLLPV